MVQYLLETDFYSIFTFLFEIIEIQMNIEIYKIEIRDDRVRVNIRIKLQKCRVIIFSSVINVS